MCQSATCNHSAASPAPASKFSLDQSAKTARTILRRATNRYLDSWDDVVSGYREAKQALIAALDPITGRREIPFMYCLSARERWDAYRKALSNCALTPVTLAIPKSAPESEEARNRWESKLAAARAVAISSSETESDYVFTLPPVGATFANSLRRFGELVSADEVESGTVAKGSALCAEKIGRAGQKIGRALGELLRQSVATNDVASSIVDYVATHSQAAPRQGTIVVSANLLDILCCSENCIYTSCHRLEGEYRAGPQQYLQDASTITVYYFEEERRFKGNELPHKLFRQMVYVDAERGAAALQRHYGQTLPDDAHKTIRREIALLLARLKGIEGEPVWTRADGDKKVSLERGANLAYLDPTVEFVQLQKGEDGRPRIQWAESVPCPECGSDLEESDSLLCPDCNGSGRNRCKSCKRQLHDDEAYSDDAGDTYCQDCYSERYTPCTRCGNDICRDDAIEAEGDSWCERCFNRAFNRCEECNDPVRNADCLSIENEGCYCESCHDDLTGRCEECTECFSTDNLDDDCRCRSCAETAADELREQHEETIIVLASGHGYPE